MATTAEIQLCLARFLKINKIDENVLVRDFKILDKWPRPEEIEVTWDDPFVATGLTVTTIRPDSTIEIRCKSDKEIEAEKQATRKKKIFSIMEVHNMCVKNGIDSAFKDLV